MATKKWNISWIRQQVDQSAAQAQEREFREGQQRGLYPAIVEAVWAPSHESNEITVSELT